MKHLGIYFPGAFSSLQGQWRDDFIFELRSCLSLYWIYEKAVLECDAKLESELLSKAPALDTKVDLSQTRKKPLKHSPKFNIQQVFFSFFKTDLIKSQVLVTPPSYAY